MSIDIHLRVISTQVIPSNLYTSQIQISYLGSAQTTCPEDIPKLSIEYFTWLLQQPSHLHPDHAQGYNRHWRTCIEKMRYENRVAKQDNITPNLTIQNTTQTPPPQQVQHVDEMEMGEQRKVSLTKRSQLIMQKLTEQLSHEQ